MTIMLWDPSLDVGVPQMNQEHQQILDVMNRLHDAHAAGKSGAMVNQLVGQLGEICVSHFADEEAHMGRIGYPELERHRSLHKRLLEQYGQHAQSIRSAGGVPNDDFFHFLKFWLSSHIKGIDMRYGPKAAQRAA